MTPSSDLKLPTKLLSGFILALATMSTLPSYRIRKFFPGINGLAVMFYPMIGLLLGALLYLTYAMLNPYLPEQHLKIVLLVLWAMLTGALHLDGFSDTIDGLFVPPERAEAVMKEPQVGAMGMIFTVLLLLIKASSLLHLNAIEWLPLVLMLARYNAVLAIFFFPYLRKNGMGSLAKRELTLTQLVIASLLVGSLLLPFIASSWLLLAGSLVTLLILGRFFVGHFGGFSGDSYGFLIEITELTLLNLLIIMNPV